ncbi:hypothetical protein [Nonomuraea cavernae]|uniref:Uncharacterized protein n=1 Tax=Nonomuraea cavernae TaxID=2045107 RepID=A0A918DU64_9ACTN|nr:hypothetical protein [Nonomuraea cavernae]MCA2189983.1 hypothetical protein [Nonomuraea cavernae]GGO82455.1 hypothetical protein GCM10012289_73730 [Nonomuraea cavernae]
MIRDDVWERLDKRAGLASRRESRRLIEAVCALALVALLVGGGWQVGGIVPRLSHAGGSGSDLLWGKDDLGRPRHPRAEARLRFVNDGWLPVTVTGVGVRADSLRLASVTVDGFTPASMGGGRFPHTIRAGGQLQLTLGLDIIDCELFDSEIVPVVFEVDHWWGTTAVTAAQGEVEGPWQEVMFRSACEFGR